mmetsp:Transcript_5299/g.17739  ORF Transcript_5299/g.17739 Transcript_5299/m.17739 type:complete len:321 (+) Transcript_5299:164-1126(+)
MPVKDEAPQRAAARQNEAVSEGWNKANASFFAGAGAGLVNSVLCAPLDLAKTRIQIQGSLPAFRGKYHGVISTLRAIYRDEGIRGCYRGLTPALITVPLFWSVFYTTYNSTKVKYKELLPSETERPWHHILSAVTAGAAADLATNPLWVVRTRMQTLHLHPESPLPENASMLRVAAHIARTEGAGAFFKGLAASLLGLTHVAVQFPIYEWLKKVSRSRNDGEEHPVHLVLASIGAKAAAVGATYPHEVLRARMQDRRGRRGSKPLGLVGTFRAIVAAEGWTSLYSGLRVNLVRIIPSTVSTFLSYELLYKWLASSPSSAY